MSLLTRDLDGISIARPLLLLPGTRETSYGTIPDFCPLRWWEQRGGVTIQIPDHALGKPFEFTVDDNMAASTLCAIALNRHLDSLNSR